MEATVLNVSDITKLERYYRKLLKQLQNLPDSTANCATYLLLGNIPLEGVWHQRILSLFGNISRLGKDHTLYRLAARQMSFSEKERPYSWFTQAVKVARKYGIDAIKVLADPLPKEAWKQKIKNSISSYWKISLLNEAKERSTLKWFLFDASDSPHGIWNACRECPHLVSAAAARAKAITGRLCINEHSWRESNACPLCGAENETTSHFLLVCPKLESKRNELTTKLFGLYEREDLPAPVSLYERTSAILNGDRYCSHPTSEVISLQTSVEEAHKVASALCYRLLKERDYIINEELMENC